MAVIQLGRVVASHTGPHWWVGRSLVEDGTDGIPWKLQLLGIVLVGEGSEWTQPNGGVFEGVMGFGG